MLIAAGCIHIQPYLGWTAKGKVVNVWLLKHFISSQVVSTHNQRRISGISSNTGKKWLEGNSSNLLQIESLPGRLCYFLHNLPAVSEVAEITPPSNNPPPLLPPSTSCTYTIFDTPSENVSHLLGWKTFPEPLKEVELTRLAAGDIFKANRYYHVKVITLHSELQVKGG